MQAWEFSQAFSFPAIPQQISYCVIMNTVIFRKQRELKKIQDDAIETQSTLLADMKTSVDALGPAAMLEDIKAMREYQNALLQRTKELLKEKELGRKKLNEQLELTDEAFNMYFGLPLDGGVSTLDKLQDAMAMRRAEDESAAE
jgi:hypothetical protein